MASHTKKPQPNSSRGKQLKPWFSRFFTFEFVASLFLDPKQLPLIGCFLFLAEIVINVLVIERVRYTEIDWKAYMQEVEGVLNGTTDYSKLSGDTGPLVYPAGFVYFYIVLYYATQQGQNIKLAQYIFGLLYLIQLLLVFRIYVRSRKVPPYAIMLSILTSYRVHSVFILRMFNDPVAIILLYASLNLFMDGKWNWGSAMFSLAVSVKMNILLFAPALLCAYLTSLSLKDTFKQLSICAGIQILLGLPFLLTYPVEYIKGAFNLGRVFIYEWTVNWRFVPESIFLYQGFHLALLGLHILLLLLFLPGWIVYLRSFARLLQVEQDLFKKQSKKKQDLQVNMATSCRLFLLPLFTANLIGMACARSLHYQFYVWYYHSLPYLLWSTPFSIPWRLAVMGILELCWNTFPSTVASSAGILVCHIILLFGLYSNRYTPNQNLHQTN